MKFKDYRLPVITFFALIHLIISLIQFDNIDWLIQYHSAVEITRGIPLYDQKSRTVGNRIIWTTHNPPLFFYMLALVMKISGNSHIAGRIFLWSFDLGIIIILDRLIILNNNNYSLSALLLYLANPVVLLILYLGLFELVMIFYLLAGIYLYIHKSYLLASLFLFLGFFVKFVPLIVLGAGSMHLLKTKKFKPLVKFFTPFSILFAGLILFMQHFMTEMIWKTTVGFQLNRSDPSQAIWYHLNLPINQLHFQLIIIFVTIILVFFLLDNRISSLILGSVFAIVVFSLILNNYYGHYILWYIPLIIPIIARIIQTRKYMDLSFICSVICLHLLSWSLCFISCFDHSQPDPTITLVTATGMFLSNLIILPIIWFLNKSYNETFSIGT